MSEEKRIRITDRVFTETYKQYWEELYRVSLRSLQDPELAREMIQDLFISLWEKREDLVIHTSLRNYLFRSLKLKILGHYRKVDIVERFEAFQQTDTSSNAQGVINTTDNAIAYKELATAHKSVVLELPDRSREVYQLSRDHGMDNRSIAARLLISEKAVEGNITRALAFIRKRLRMFR